MILKHFTRRWYHIRKPRVVTQNKLSLHQYRNTLRQARKQVHIEAKEYQQMIENQYLQKHSEQMKLRHFNNQCDFRKRIAQEGFKLQQNLQYWRKQDQKTQSKVNKHIHDEDLKRMNRERIKKIMTYESENYWYTSDNADQRLTDDVIFPQYIANTQYYHRLHSEGLAYEGFDFNMLNRLRSNQQVIKQKNKLLIPIFNSIKTKIKQYKTDKQKEINYYHQIELDKINMLQNISQKQRNKLIQEENKSFEQKIQEYKLQLSDPGSRRNLIKRKLRILLAILGEWKQYTNILGMTSGQMMRKIEEAKRESHILSIRKTVMQEIRAVKYTTFVDAIEEDTEDVEVSLEDYISNLKAQQIQQEDVVNQKSSVQHIQLDGLLSQAESQLSASGLKQSKEQSLKIDLSSMVQGLQHPTQLQVDEIPNTYLNFSETTSSIQVMKEIHHDDAEMLKLLNQIGEVTVEYPKLLETLWQTTRPVV